MVRLRAPQAIGTPVETGPPPVSIGPQAIGTPVEDVGPPPAVIGPAHPSGGSRRLRPPPPGPRLQVRAQVRPPTATMAGRVREALRCPFCHDAISRTGGVACARRRCGALYHRACWDECVSHYGGCAAMGCGCTQATGVGRVGFSFRVLRLALAALLFPPRVLKQIEQAGDQVDVAAIRAALEDRARDADDALWGRGGRRLRGGYHDLWGTFQLFAVVAPMALACLITSSVTAMDQGSDVPWILGCTIGSGVLTTLLLYRSTRAAALALYMAQAILQGEVGALARAGAAGGWIAQVRAGGGKKPG